MFEGEKCFRELARAMPEPVWVVGSDGRLVYGNPRWYALTEIAAGDDFTTAYLSLIHPEDRQHWVNVWQHAFRTRGAYEVERRARLAPHRAYVRQLERGQPVRDASGDAVEWVLTASIAHDEGQQLVEGLRRCLAQKNEALIAVAHELRSPLAPIANAIQLLERRGSDPQCVADMRALIGRQVTQLVRLVEDLLDLGRLEQRQLDIRKERTELRRVLAAAVETAQPIISARRCQLTTAVLSDNTIVDGDEGRLTQVVVNLLVNAAKFTDNGGQISVALEGDGTAFIIRVRDTGIGIAPDMLPRIFDPYVRGARGSSSGLGLGLALARELAQLHGGVLTASSEGVGKGSEFVLKLPAAHPRNAADAE